MVISGMVSYCFTWHGSILEWKKIRWVETAARDGAGVEQRPGDVDVWSTLHFVSSLGSWRRGESESVATSSFNDALKGSPQDVLKDESKNSRNANPWTMFSCAEWSGAPLKARICLSVKLRFHVIGDVNMRCFFFAERQRGSMDARGQRQGRRADGHIHNLNIISNMNIERSRTKIWITGVISSVIDIACMAETFHEATSRSSYWIEKGRSWMQNCVQHVLFHPVSLCTRCCVAYLLASSGCGANLAKLQLSWELLRSRTLMSSKAVLCNMGLFFSTGLLMHSCW